MFSSTDSGVWPNCSRNFLEGFFLRLEISPRSITTSCSYVLPSIWSEPKENLSKRIRETPWTLASGALVRRDSGEGGPALLNVLAAAVRTQDFALFVSGEWKNLVEEFLAIVAQEFVVRHRDLARS